MIYMKELVPGLGDKRTTKRIRELEKNAGTLPVIFALFFTEAIKITAAGIPIPFVPETAWFHFLGEALKFLLMAIAIGLAYVFEDERQKAIETAQNKSKEKAEKVKDTVTKDSEPDPDIQINVFGKKIKCTFHFLK